ncbi:MAG: hypothetical protein AAF799_26620 [Myxococcota bacterium]
MSTPDSRDDDPLESASSPADGDDAQDSDTSGSFEARAAWLAALVAVLLAAPFIAGPHDFPLDDAWIHLSYAKSLRLGDGASYNPGDGELGFSSPLWMVLLAVWPIAGDPVRPVQLLGLLLHGLTAWVAAHLGLSLARERASVEAPMPLLSITLLAGVFAAATPTLVQAATSGMEVSLTAALVLAVAWAMVSGRVGASAILGALAVLARPEALGFVVALAAGLSPWRWRSQAPRPAVVAPLAAVVGAATALALWLGYCFMMLEQWWPNAQYVKGEGGGLEGLGYISEQVLPWQPWLISASGVILVVLAARNDLKKRRPELVALLAATLLTLFAIALSRPLDPSTQFYQRRYFTPFVVVITVLLPFGLPLARRWLALLLVVPIAIASGLQIHALHERTQGLRADIHQLHGALAETIVEQLPADARIAVEGAGAPRFFAPRSMIIIDLVGLNDHEMAQQRDDVKGKLCHVVRQRPTHFAIPADWVGSFAPVFALRPIARFDDPVYTQVDPPRALTLLLLEVEDIHPAWVEGCATGTP